MLKQSDIYNNYLFNREDLDRIKVDISFIEYTGIQNETKLAVDYALGEMIIYPEIKPIIHVLKRFLYIYNLNSSFNGKPYLEILGGLSSYSLFLMVLAFIKHIRSPKSQILGQILFELLEIYGKIINFKSCLIDTKAIW